MKKLIPFFLILYAINTLASETYGDISVDKVTQVYDGDSFKVNIHSWPDIIGKEVIIRVNKIDAPEMHGKCEKERLLAKLAQQHTANLIDKAFRVELKNIMRDQYFRIKADVYIDREHLGNSLLLNKLAVPYSGGPQHDWCK